jgi:hypothetical protein
MACSDTDVLPKPPWRLRKAAYIDHLKTAPDSVLRVSLADKLNNLRAIVRDYGVVGEGLWERFDPDADPVWYYGSLLRIFEERLPSPITAELKDVPATDQTDEPRGVDALNGWHPYSIKSPHIRVDGQRQFALLSAAGKVKGEETGEDLLPLKRPLPAISCGNGPI